MSKKSKEVKAQVKAQVKKENDAQHVKMRFTEDKFYNDLNNPKYVAGTVYDIVGADMIQRWLNRGGEIVEGELTCPKVEDNSSVVVENQHSESNPFEGNVAPKIEEQESVQVDTDEDAGDSEDNQQDET